MKTTYKKYLPSKKFLIVFSVIVLIIILFFIFKNVDFNKKQETDKRVNLALNSADDIETVLRENDTDGDGLSDWEEVLWGMDISNPDTDGDGIPDGIEVARQRSKMAIVEETYEEEPKEILTKTESLARNLYTALAIAIKESPDGQLSTETYSEIVNNVSGHIKEIGKSELITYLDVETISTTNESVKFYVSEMDKLPKNIILSDRDFEIIASALQDKSKNINEIKRIHKKYTNLKKQIMTVLVPDIIRDEHLSFVNGINDVVNILDNISATETDDIVIVSQLINYSENLVKIGEAMESMESFFFILEEFKDEIFVE